MRIIIITSLISFAVSCGNNNEPLSAKQISEIKDSVRQMTTSVAKDVSREGPVAWLHYFEHSPDFFMASDGQLVFPSIDSARIMINNVVAKIFAKIILHWGNMRINVLSEHLAEIAANFHEDVTDSTGKTMPVDGYFTALAHETQMGWKLRDAHWSISPTK